MRKIYISLWLLIASVQYGMAQNNNSAPAVFGCASSNGATSTCNVPFMIGQAIYSNYVAAAQCHDGFPYDAQYLQNTFVGGLWSSKGYYADYVLLQWSIGNNASSITSFVVSRRLLSDTAANFQVVATLDPSVMSWQDQYCETGTLYQYKVYATGITNVLTLNLNYVTAIGFRQPVGTATGRITYSGGTAVPGVSVLAQTNPAIPTSALVFNGTTSYGLIDEKTKGSLTSGSAFTFQAWVNTSAPSTSKQVLFNKQNIAYVYLQDNNVYFQFNNFGIINLSYAPMVGKYFHITAVLNGNTLLLQLNNGDTILQIKKTFAGGLQAPDLAEGMYIGASGSNHAQSFTGLMDEIRIWSTALDSATIQRDYGRVLTGTETGLEAYYQCNEGVGSMAYDETHTGNSYNSDDATLYNVGWTNQTPSLLYIKGITDANGNYQISGIPYIAGGSTYTFTPLFGVHTFSPTQALRYFAPGSNVSNNVDFTDNSSFKVSGRVVYNKTDVPVQGVTVLVDGTTAISNRTPVTTDASGTFTVDVPIGFHRITLSKQGHTFVDGFPTKTYKNPVTGKLDSLYDFENDIVSPISFYDATLATIAGRVAGGTVEKAKALGFKLSKSNLGYGKITLEMQTTGLMREKAGDSTVTTSGNDVIKSRYAITQNAVTIYPDTTTGEYAVQLPPGTYTVNSAYGNAYTRKNGTYSNADYDFSTQNGLGQIILDITKKDSSQYNFTDSVLVKGKKVAHADSSIYRFNKRYDFIWRNAPSIQVIQAGQKYFGDSLVVFTNNNGTPTDSLHLIKKQKYSLLYPDTSVYHFGYPVFHQQVSYTFKISVYEKYINYANGVTDSIPQNDGGSMVISNALATTTSFSDTLDHKGALTYTFTGGSPNVVSPYTSSATFQYNYKLNSVAEAVTWQSGLTGIILGGQSTGSNFVTAGPTNVDMILRDPPGSGSSASLQKGTTTTKSTTITGANIIDFGLNTTSHFGASITSGVGLGAMVISTIESKTDLQVGFTQKITNTGSGTITTSTTNTEQWSTSSDPAYVGSQGDVFIGHSTNVTYSKTLNVGIIKDSTGTPIVSTGNSYAISPQFGTAFMYTQYHIINELLPNIKKMRDNFFIQDADVYVQHKPGVYVNTNTETVTINGETYIQGDAYDFHPSVQLQKVSTLTQASDSIKVYNQWIANWDTILANNEKIKALAIKNVTSSSTNISFDAGTNYQNTSTSTNSTAGSYEFSSETYIKASVQTGALLNKVGVVFDISGDVGITVDVNTGSQTDNSTTYSYTLADNSQGDYYSVDVLPAPDGFGPVFRTRGGQSMCPYEGQELTQYYEPGEHVLNVATEQNQIPYILANKNKRATELNVPSNQQATFSLSLQNLAQSGINGQFNLSLVQNSNANGALIAVDGVSLTQNNGLVFYIPSLGSVTKTLTIAKGPSAILSDTIGIVLSTSCGDVSDTVWVNAQFTPACTAVTLNAPLDQWTMNGITGSSLPLKAGGFNANEQNFQSICFEYKPSSSSGWSPLVYFFNDSTSQLYKNYQGEKAVIPSGGSVAYTWDASQMADQNYDIRARSNCADNITAYSSVASGIKDLSPLQVFGTPSPSTGILGIGENISMQFNKPIVAGKIQPNYVQVNGVLNGSKIAHATSLNLDGASGYAKADGFSFTNSPFTVEFWMQRPDANDTGVVFSKGSTTTDKLEIANTAGGKMQITIGSKSYAVDATSLYNTTTPPTAWHHYAVVYDTTKTLTVYGDEDLVPLVALTDVSYSPKERGPVYLGRSVSGNSYGQAHLDEIRIWNITRSISDIVANMSVLLSGSQQGLIAYWPCNEGNGTQAADRAASHTLTVNTPWEIALTNQAVAFDAMKQQALLINARQLTLSNEQNATIEFWFKAPAQTDRACLFSNGVKDSTAKGPNPLAFGLFIEPSGILTVTSGGVTNNATSTSVSDNAWHHFALVIDRLSNVRTYLDGNLQKQLNTSLFSSIVGLDMSLGAYHEQVTSTSTLTNKYFTGMIDEFRIWETARQASLVTRYKNTKLTGKEDGLLYYFPFEAYYNMSNVQVLGTTYNNIVDSASLKALGVARTDTVVAIAINGAGFTTQAPAVKDAQPLTNLAVTYEVNNDKLLINLPTQYASLYENCILEISVRNIFDKNGNMLQSPAQWTAYINQNPVIWGTSSDSLSTLSGEGGIFTATILNKSGVAKDFTINGLPAWLTANPQSGILQPSSSQSVFFTVNSGLNIGSYSQFINLTTDYGYDEKLQVEVTVKAQAPNWTVDASKYQYMMNVFGKLSINGVIATNENTMLAAFVNGECRGVTSLKYLSSFDLTEAMLSIYSNSDQGETIELRIWDASTGKTYTNVTPAYTFVSDKVYGTPKAPELISCDNTLLNTYTLGAGWNWISVNVKNTKSNSVNNLFSTIGSEGDEIKSQKKGFDKYSKLAGWSGTLDTTSGLNPADMYKMKLTTAGVVTIGGKPVDAATTILPISKGWNWIGFVPEYTVTVNEALASYGPVDGDLVKSQKAFSMYYTGIGWIGSLTVMEPGKGYMLQSTNASSLVYPEKGLLKDAVEQTATQAPKVLAYIGGQAQSNSTVLAQVADGTIDVNGKILAAYNGNVCVGYASAVNSPSGKTLYFVTADESSTLKFALVDTITGLKTAFVNSLTTSSDSHIGQIDNPYLLYTTQSTSSDGGVVSELSVYPNPFQSSLIVKGNLIDDSPVSIRLINDLGKEMLVFNTTKTKGSFTIDINEQTTLEKLPQGVYIVEVRTNDGIMHTTVIKQ